MGQIAASAGKKHGMASPLTVEIEQFVKMTAVIATLTGAVFVILSMVLVDSDFLTQFVFFVGEITHTHTHTHTLGGPSASGIE